MADARLDFLHKNHTALCGGKLVDLDKSAQVKGMLIEGSKWFEVGHNYVNHFYNEIFKSF